jgi:hypothetical protein
MIDILKRLRADPTLNSALEEEAAAEIERLRLLVDALQLRVKFGNVRLDEIDPGKSHDHDHGP